MTQPPDQPGQQPDPRFGSPPPPPYAPPPAAPGYGPAPTAPQAPGVPPGSAPGATGIPGMGRRLVARIVDGLLLGVVLLPLALVFGVFDSLTGSSTTASSVNFGFNGVTLLIGAVYEVGLIATRGATLGKQLLGIKVVTIETGARPDFGAAALRWLIPAIGAFVCGIGQLVVYASPLFDNTGRLQGWHDKVAKTQVVNA
ncbi:MAG: RDD family protein [Angustibacter sp.]